MYMTWSTRPSRLRLVLTVSFAVALVIAACGEEESSNNGGSTFVNNGGSDDAGLDNNGGSDDAGTDTGGRPDPACEGVMCEGGETCVKGLCVDESLKVACNDVVDLGTVVEDETTTASGDTSDWADWLETDCASDETVSGAENVFRFQADVSGILTISLSSEASIDWVMEVREACDDADARVTCSDPEETQLFVSTSKTYYLIVEPGAQLDRGAFDLELDLQKRVCSTPGSRTCDGDTLKVCRPSVEDILQCAGSCADGACAGDTCDNPIEVTASMSFSGDTGAYTNEFDFVDQPSCSEGGGGGIATVGPDLVLSLPGLTSGDKVTVDASKNDDNDNAIFVLKGCQAGLLCQAAADSGDVLDFDVVEDDDYFIVIDKLSTTAKSFNYTVDIQ